MTATQDFFQQIDSFEDPLERQGAIDFSLGYLASFMEREQPEHLMTLVRLLAKRA